jgi:guanylate kinase
MLKKNGVLIVLSGPSGCGKGTVLKEIVSGNDSIRVSVSATTRDPREDEIDGVNYFFKGMEEFKRMIAQNELVEWVEYCGNCYGTPRCYIEESMKNGYDVILEIEIEGAANIKKQYPDSILVFLLPPSFDELMRRIQNRGTESEDIIEKRMAKAKKEVLSAKEYDYLVINDDVEKSKTQIIDIIKSEKLKMSRNINVLESFS